jgi:hypothetical protein
MEFSFLVFGLHALLVEPGLDCVEVVLELLGSCGWVTVRCENCQRNGNEFMPDSISLHNAECLLPVHRFC